MQHQQKIVDSLLEEIVRDYHTQVGTGEDWKAPK
jgi:hypothetical protein